MYRKALAKITATMMVITMVGTANITSFATDNDSNAAVTQEIILYTEGEPQVVPGDVVVEEGRAIAVHNNSSLTVNGDVTGAVSAGSGADLTVNGDVISNGDNNLIGHGGALVEAYSDASIRVSGNVDGSRIVTDRTETNERMYLFGRDRTNATGVIVYDTETTSGGASAGIYTWNGDVTVGGDVIGGQYGVDVRGDSTVKVEGNVISNGQEVVESGYKYLASDGAVFERVEVIEDGYTRYEYNVIEPGAHPQVVGSSYLESTGIYTDGEGNIIVAGDVKSQRYGISIDPEAVGDGDAGSIVVLGTIKAENVGISVSDNVGYAFRQLEEGLDDQTKIRKVVEDAANDMPSITVYAIEANTAVTGGHNGYTEAEKEASRQIFENVVNAINYIIKQDDASNSDYGITVNATNQEIAGENYLTARINQAFAVAAALPEGYTISAGEYVNVVDNGNGTFTLTLTDLRGGINIKAVLKQVEAPAQGNQSDSYAVVVEEVTSTAAPAGGVVVTNASSAPSDQQTAELISKISGDRPAQTATFDFGKISVAQYKEAVIQNVQSVPQNGALNIISNKLSVFDTSMMQVISARSDIDVNVVFSYGGKQYKVVIPAGYDVMSLLDEHGYCGFLRLLAVLGGEEIA